MAMGGRCGVPFCWFDLVTWRGQMIEEKKENPKCQVFFKSQIQRRQISCHVKGKQSKSSIVK